MAVAVQIGEGECRRAGDQRATGGMRLEVERRPVCPRKTCSSPAPARLVATKTRSAVAIWSSLSRTRWFAGRPPACPEETRRPVTVGPPASPRTCPAFAARTRAACRAGRRRRCRAGVSPLKSASRTACTCSSPSVERRGHLVAAFERTEQHGDRGTVADHQVWASVVGEAVDRNGQRVVEGVRSGRRRGAAKFPVPSPVKIATLRADRCATARSSVTSLLNSVTATAAGPWAADGSWR